MSSSSRTAPGARRSGVRARSRRYRNRRLAALGLLIGVILLLAVVIIPPLFRKAESEFGLPLSYAGIIRQQAAETHLDPALIAAVSDAETKFDARTSPAGAEGLMQIEPATAEFLAHRSGGVGFTVSDL